MKNSAYYMTGLESMEKREIPMPEIGEKDVLVKLEYVGICGSDVHYLEYGRVGGFAVEGDFILGHECAGTVAAVGAGVTTLKIGDRVALEPGITCGKCCYCKSGKYNLCPDVKFLATPPYDGCLCNYISFPENMCFQLPENLSSKDGALIEPLAVGMHAAAQGGVTVGNSVIIFGAGCIGLVTLLACKARGAGKVIVVDVMPKRLAFAKKLGADLVVNAAEQDAGASAKLLNGGDGCDVVIETAGSSATIAQTPYLVRRGGRVVLVGLAVEEILPFNFAQIMAKEVTISSVFRYRNIYPAAIEAVSQGKIDVSQIVTHTFSFDKSPEAFDYVIHHKADVVKAIIKIE